MFRFWPKKEGFMIKLVMKIGANEIKTIESDKDELSIGRNPNNDIVVENLAVSDRHARILRGQDGYVLQDLDSTNGSFVNEKKISQVVLQTKDTISIGKHILEVVKLSPQSSASSREGGAPITEKTMKLDTKRHKEMLKKQ
jgi:pSer/pThr/pTyr-binding forkhead associated (FHA) protein